jgi:hypothetical protein
VDWGTAIVERVTPLVEWVVCSGRGVGALPEWGFQFAEWGYLTTGGTIESC